MLRLWRLCVVCLCFEEIDGYLQPVCVCVCFFSVRSITFLIEQKHHLLQESFTVRHPAHRVQFPTEMTFPEVCSAADQTAGSVEQSLQEPDQNKSIQRDGLPTRNHMRIKCKCRALHFLSAASHIRRDSQITFNVGAREKHFTPPFSRLRPPFCRS